MKTVNFFTILVVLCLMTSCYTTLSVTETITPEKYAKDTHDHLVGKTKSEILSEMSVPDRVMDDGLGGEILVYEKKEQVTETKGKQTSSSSTRTSYTPHKNYYTGGVSNVTGTGYTSTSNSINTKSVTKERKDYVNAYLNKEGVCYKVDSEIYQPAVTTEKCYKKLDKAMLWWLCPPFTFPVGIGMAIWYLVDKDKLKPCNK